MIELNVFCAPNSSNRRIIGVVCMAGTDFSCISTRRSLKGERPVLHRIGLWVRGVKTGFDKGQDIQSREIQSTFCSLKNPRNRRNNTIIELDFHVVVIGTRIRNLLPVSINLFKVRTGIFIWPWHTNGTRVQNLVVVAARGRSDIQDECTSMKVHETVRYLQIQTCHFDEVRTSENATYIRNGRSNHGCRKNKGDKGAERLEVHIEMKIPLIC